MKRFAAAVLILLLALTGCAEDTGESRTVFAMDTAMAFTLYGKNAAAAADRIEREIYRLDGLFSVTDEESEVARLNAGAGAFVDVSAETAEIAAAAKRVGAETAGAFDITVHPLVAAWGFFTKQYTVPDAGEIGRLLGAVGYERIETEENRVKLGAGQSVDFGGIAKGYLTDRIWEILREEEITDAKLLLGGNVLVTGSRPGGGAWNVGLQDPNDLAEAFGTLKLRDAAVVTSGSYQRYFERDGTTYHHIIDPESGYPAESGLVSVSVVAKDGARADGLSTALFVMGAKRAEEFWRERRDFGMALVTGDGEVYLTKDLEDVYTPREESGYTLRVIE